MAQNPYLPVDKIIQYELENNKELTTAERLALIHQLAELTLARRNYLRTRKERYKPNRRYTNTYPQQKVSAETDKSREVGDILDTVRSGA